MSSPEACVILKSCDREGISHINLIDEIWTALKNQVSLDITHYNALLNIYINHEMDFDPAKLLEEMKNADIARNR